ncbi:superoxide dismutase family protein [Rhizorhabdus phycosphaerae]|uniref:superoxide dismutase family protein n=1 Tax=Rhizorhabdus phycosphaerae TaxID=2711156 RepID=UPI0013ED9990
MRSLSSLISLTAAAGLAFYASSAPAQHAGHQAMGHDMAQANLVDAAGKPIGKATLMQHGDAIMVQVKASGLTPGVHAVHIHTTGTCTAPDFASAGGHWNPAKHQHGRDNPAGAHMGDMPNMTVAADGTGTLSTTVSGAMLSGGENPLLDADGAAIVIHAAADDYKTDPTGNAGGRLACGVVAKS